MNLENYVASRQKEIRLETDIITLLLEELGNPHLSNKYIHITGTNGKGSVATFTDSICRKSGLSVCRFSSPHLVTPEDSLLYNGIPVTKDELSELYGEIEPCATEIQRKHGRYPSPFEMLTAAAFLFFRKKNPDIVILEVGMGGEGDATNVIPSPAVAVITPISRDHDAYLGTTEEQIAIKKSAIIKSGCKVISAVQPTEAEKIIRKKAEAEKASLITVKPFPDSGFSDIYEWIQLDGRKVLLSLGGVAQRENAAIATEIAKSLLIEDKYIAQGLEAAVHPARFEKISDNLYFDGAHNISGATALRKSADRYFANKKILYIMGVMKDKDYGEMLKILNNQAAGFIFVPFAENERAALPEDLLSKAKSLGISAKESDFEAALREDGLKIVCGSLYLYKDFIKTRFYTIKQPHG